MIYITGDIHGDIDRFKKADRKLKKNDTLIICGDFGFVWDGSAKEKKLLQYFGKKKYTILFADGVHENFKELASFPEKDFSGGKVFQISGRLYYAPRGEFYTIEDKKIFIFGGGHTDSRDVDVIPDAIPSEADIEYAIDNLARNNFKTDFIISYEPPSKVADFLNPDEHSHVASDTIERSTDFKYWIFGDYHVNKVLGTRFGAIYDVILPLNDDILKSLGKIKDKRKAYS